MNREEKDTFHSSLNMVCLSHTDMLLGNDTFCASVLCMLHEVVKTLQTQKDDRDVMRLWWLN